MTTTQPEVYDPFGSEEHLRIDAIQSAETPVLVVSFSDGIDRRVDLSETIARSKWFRALAEQTTFETVEIINDGRALQWITGADYCADALRILADKQYHGLT